MEPRQFLKSSTDDEELCRSLVQSSILGDNMIYLLVPRIHCPNSRQRSYQVDLKPRRITLGSVLVGVLISICEHQNVVIQHTDLAEYRTWVKCTYKVRGDDRAVVPILSERMTASTFRLPTSIN